MTETDQEKSQSPTKGRSKTARTKEEKCLNAKAKTGKKQRKVVLEKRHEDQHADVITTAGPNTKKSEEGKPLRRGKQNSSTRVDDVPTLSAAPKATAIDAEGGSQSLKECKPVQSIHSVIGGKQVPVQVVN